MEQQAAIEKFIQEGIRLVRQGMLHQALALFERILTICPGEPRALFNAAVVLDQRDLREDALTLLQQSMDADPTFANPHYYLGRMRLQEGNYSGAYSAFRDAIARDVEFTPAYEGIQIALSAMNQTPTDDTSDIVFYTGGHPFHDRTINEKGLGGSESALIYIARSFAAKGMRVHVFCNCDQPGEYAGVRYDRLVDFYIYRKQHILPMIISSRSLRPFKIALQAQTRILWIHDAANVPFLKGEDPVRTSIDRIFAVSHWQRNDWSSHFGIPLERFFVTRNGVDLSVFRPGGKRSRCRLIYVSRHDRGLNVLLKLFPYIRQQVPDAELHVYSYQLPDDRVDEIVLEVQQPGVYIRGSLPKTDLASEMASARLMVYPSTWPETSCISAIESQASGTPVVTSTLAALSETVHDGVSGCLIPGDPNTAEFGRCFIETVVKLMNNDEVWTKLSHGARHRSELLYDWNNIANEWVGEFERLIDIKKRGL